MTATAGRLLRVFVVFVRKKGRDGDRGYFFWGGDLLGLVGIVLVIFGLICFLVGKVENKIS